MASIDKMQRPTLSISAALAEHEGPVPAIDPLKQALEDKTKAQKKAAPKPKKLETCCSDCL